MSLLGGWFCEVTYTNPLLSPSLKNYFTPIKGTGTCPLVPLAMPVTVVQPGFVNGGLWEGGFPPPTVGRKFENSCMKTAFSCTLNTIIRGSLCTGTNSLLSFFHSFPNEFVLWEHFPFSLSFFLFFFFFLLADQQGGHGPLVPPLAMPVTADAQWYVWKTAEDNRLMKAVEEGTTHDLVDYICSLVPQFLEHTYIKRHQASQYQTCKERATNNTDPEEALIQVDFSEKLHLCRSR